MPYYTDPYKATRDQQQKHIAREQAERERLTNYEPTQEEIVNAQAYARMKESHAKMMVTYPAMQVQYQMLLDELEANTLSYIKELAAKLVQQKQPKKQETLPRQTQIGNGRFIDHDPDQPGTKHYTLLPRVHGVEIHAKDNEHETI